MSNPFNFPDSPASPNTSFPMANDFYAHGIESEDLFNRSPFKDSIDSKNFQSHSPFSEDGTRLNTSGECTSPSGFQPTISPFLSIRPIQPSDTSEYNSPPHPPQEDVRSNSSPDLLSLCFMNCDDISISPEEFTKCIEIFLGSSSTNHSLEEDLNQRDNPMHSPNHLIHGVDSEQNPTIHLPPETLNSVNPICTSNDFVLNNNKYIQITVPYLEVNRVRPVIIQFGGISIRKVQVYLSSNTLGLSKQNTLSNTESSFIDFSDFVSNTISFFVIPLKKLGNDKNPSKMNVVLFTESGGCIQYTLELRLVNKNGKFIEGGNYARVYRTKKNLILNHLKWKRFDHCKLNKCNSNFYSKCKKIKIQTYQNQLIPIIQSNCQSKLLRKHKTVKKVI